MSPRSDLISDGGDVHIGKDEDFILLRVTEEGVVTTISTLDEDDAVDLLRQTADAIEAEGFERQRVTRLS